MGRRKSGPWEKALKEASRELNLPVDNWTVERLATLNLAFRVSRSKWTSGQAAGSADMVTLMEQITKLRAEAKAQEPMDIQVHFVKAMVSKCSRCGHLEHLDADKVADNIELTRPDTPSAESRAADAPVEPQTPSSDDVVPPLPAAITTGVKGYRPNVSGSAFHSAVLHNNEVAPLAKLQPGIHPSPRPISPMSQGPGEITPHRRHNAPPQGSALDDPNPNRKAN